MHLTVAATGKVILIDGDNQAAKYFWHRYYNNNLHHVVICSIFTWINEKKAVIRSNDVLYSASGMHTSPSMKLLGAVILIRHGDRLPISRPPVAHHPTKRNSCFLDDRTQPSTPLLSSFISTVGKCSYVFIIILRLPPSTYRF